MRAKYSAFVPDMAVRHDLNRVIRWMLSELSVGHSYITNFGEVNTQGIDFALNTTLRPNWVLDVGYSWFDFEVERDIPGDPLQANAPENQFKTGLSYLGQALDASAKFRWVDEFEGHLTFGIGLRRQVGFRVLELRGPARLAIDVARRFRRVTP